MKRRTKEPGSESDTRCEFMTLHDVARHLKCPYRTLYQLIVHERTLSAFWVGNDWRVRRSDLEKWIALQHVCGQRESERDK